ncbi:hypothetical protein ACJ41O_008802 [Fusarium nematophilum]
MAGQVAKLVIEEIKADPELEINVTRTPSPAAPADSLTRNTHVDAETERPPDSGREPQAYYEELKSLAVERIRDGVKADLELERKVAQMSRLAGPVDSSDRNADAKAEVEGNSDGDRGLGAEKAPEEQREKQRLLRVIREMTALAEAYRDALHKANGKLQERTEELHELHRRTIPQLKREVAWLKFESERLRDDFEAMDGKWDGRMSNLSAQLVEAEGKMERAMATQSMIEPSRTKEASDGQTTDSGVSTGTWVLNEVWTSTATEPSSANIKEQCDDILRRVKAGTMGEGLAAATQIQEAIAAVRACNRLDKSLIRGFTTRFMPAVHSSRPAITTLLPLWHLATAIACTRRRRRASVGERAAEAAGRHVEKRLRTGNAREARFVRAVVDDAVGAFCKDDPLSSCDRTGELFIVLFPERNALLLVNEANLQMRWVGMENLVLDHSSGPFIHAPDHSENIVFGAQSGGSVVGVLDEELNRRQRAGQKMCWPGNKVEARADFTRAEERAGWILMGIVMIIMFTNKD